MNWTDQMQQLMSSWVDAQQAMASEWSSAVSRASSTTSEDSTEWATKWREATAKSYENFLSGIGGVPGSVAQRIFGGAQTYNRFVDFITKMFREVAPKMGAEIDWADALSQYMENLKAQMNGKPYLWMTPEASAAMGDDLSELWTLFLAQCKSMSAPWADSLSTAHGHFGEAISGDHRAIIRMANLFTDTFESTMGKFMGAPAIGYSREHQEKLSRTFDAWVEMKKAEASFNIEMMSIGFGAMEKLVSMLKEKAGSGEKIESIRELFDLWTDVAEKTYYASASTESFAKTQAELVNSAMRYRIEEKKLAEIFYKAFHIPTRQELDDAYKHMHEMRKQVKALTKTVSSLEKQIASLSTARPAEEAVASPAANVANAAPKAPASAEKKTAATGARKTSPSTKSAEAKREKAPKTVKKNTAKVSKSAPSSKTKEAVTKTSAAKAESSKAKEG